MGTVSLEQYLHSPVYEHCEYVDGEIVGIHAGDRDHSQIQIRLGRQLDEYFDRHPGYAGTELRCRLHVGGQIRYRLPDVCAVLREFTTDYLEGAPELAVEIKSPEDSTAVLLRKAGDYFANGCRLVWIVLPEERAVLVLTPAGVLQTVLEGEMLDGGDLLPGFAVPLAAILPRSADA